MSGASPSQRWIVLDTGALIAGTDALYALGGLTEGLNGQSVPSLSDDERAVFYVTPDVASETRDARSRARLQALDRVGCVVQRAPSAEAVAAAADAAKNSGDYPVLSAADLRVLALTWMLEVERNGHEFLTEVPKSTVIGEIRRVPGVSFEDLERWEREELERKEKEEAEWDGWTTVPGKKERPVKKPKRKKKKKKPQSASLSQEGLVVGSTIPIALAQGGEYEISTIGSPQIHDQEIPEANTVGKLVSDVEPADRNTLRASEPNAPFDSFTEDLLVGIRNSFAVKNDTACMEEHHEEPGKYPQPNGAAVRSSVEPKVMGEEIFDDDGEGWINEDNLEEHLARDGGEEEMTVEDRMRVACVTTDFAMQNTMLQMGLKLLSVDGRRTIRQIRRFALRCQSCSTVTRQLNRKFCDKCGNASLHRVAFKVDKKGVARVFLNPKKKPNLRGTKYSIPMPRGGRHNKDLILCEDQIDPVKQRRLDKQRERQNVDVLDPSNFYNAGAKFNPHDRPLIVGYGKRNPNQVRPGNKGKR